MGRNTLILVDKQELEDTLFGLLNEYASAKDEVIREQAKELVEKLTWPSI